MTGGGLVVTVLADVADPAWRGQIEPSQREERAHLFTDIFLGLVRFSILDGPRTTQVETPSARAGVFGFLYTVAKGLESGGATVIPDYVGNQLTLHVAGSEARLSDGSRDIVTSCSELSRGLDAAFGEAMALAQATVDRGSLPSHLDEMRAQIGRWAADRP